MLQLKTVNKETIALLKDLLVLDIFQEFTLAGGTGLALQIGHRISVDLDFFTLHTFDSVELFEHIRESFTVSDASPAVNSLSLFVAMNDERIKIDLLRHNYPLLRPVHIVENVPLYSLEDIVAMKLNAIANRGAKKDFYDVHALLNYFTVQDMLRFFQQKYEQMNTLTVVKSLVYFEDADQEPDPLSLENTSWADIKNELVKQIQILC